MGRLALQLAQHALLRPCARRDDVQLHFGRCTFAFVDGNRRARPCGEGRAVECDGIYLVEHLVVQPFEELWHLGQQLTIL